MNEKILLFRKAVDVGFDFRAESIGHSEVAELCSTGRGNQSG